jgi:hypothetical protein
LKNEAKALLEQAHRALAAARRDLAAEDSDNAVSRAYYAAFHAASAALNETGQAARSHKGTHHLFYMEHVETGRLPSKYSQTLAYLFQLRQDADYVSGATFSLETATDALHQAEAFVAAVKRVLG